MKNGQTKKLTTQRTSMEVELFVINDMHDNNFLVIEINGVERVCLPVSKEEVGNGIVTLKNTLKI